MRSTKLAPLALAGALALGLTACGGGSDSQEPGASGGSSPSTGGGSSSSASSAPATTPSPVAKLDNLSNGKTTAVKLDAGFVKGLQSLKLTPGTVGTAKLTDGSLVFPITGGNVTVYPKGSVDPYVQGLINHQGSGFSLTDGKTKVEITNLDVDPGTSMIKADVSANGKSVIKDAPIFNADGSTLKDVAMEGSDAVLEGTTVTLTKEAAALLNKTYGTDALAEFFKVGIAKITVGTK